MRFKRVMISALCLVFLGVICSAYNFMSARAALPPAALDANDWPMYLHDSAHSGRTPATVYNDGPLFIQWAYSFGERVEIEAQPIVANGVLYQGVMNGEMHALNASTGQVKWIRTPGGPIAHTAATDGTRVYFGTLDNNVYALNVSDGSLAWSFATGGPVESAPTVVNNVVYIGSNDGKLYALDAANGAKIWQVQTGGPVITSPAVVNGRVYFGSEDLKAYCASAANGDVLWETQLYGFSMHNTHPIVSDDGQVVIFFTVKAGASSYVPTEDYPDASSSANPVDTWNAYYHTHPTYRTLFYLSTSAGTDLWDYGNKRYVPMPIPYWGLLYPVLHPDGSAYFAAPSGADGFAFELDHDNRLMRIDLTTGAATQVAGGSLPEFQTRMDEVGRYMLAGTGNDVNLYLSSSEDLGVYHLSSQTITGLFGDRNPSTPWDINFGSHVKPLSPLPSLHIRRYAGATSMGAVPATSVPVIANNMAYMTSWGWLYALGPTDHGYNPATSFPSRDARLYKETGAEYTYPRARTPTVAEIRSEISQRVADIIATGVSGPALNVRWEQPGGDMIYNETPFETYGYDFQVVRALSEAYPFLSPSQQAQLKSYLSGYLAATLLNSSDYAYVYQCLYFGETAIRTGMENCGGPNLRTQWFVDNPNFIGQRLYALWVYAKNTGDWATISAHWSLISDQLGLFVDAYDSSLGYCVFPMWHAGRLNLGAQIAAAEGLRNMAEHLGDTGVYNQANTLLNNLLNGRVALANFVPNLYDQGARQPAQLRLNPDGTINHADIMGPGSPFASNMSPFRGNELNRDTDPAQLNWAENGDYEVDEGVGFMYYAALSGYFPLTDEMSARLRSSLLDKTRLYVNTYEVHDPWWWMSDSGHSTSGSGEHLYHSPTLAWSMFQVKARILDEAWQTLARELPEAVSTNSKYDFYRLQNLATLLERSGNTAPDFGATTLEVTPPAANSGDTVHFVVTIRNEGGPITSTAFMTDTLPAGLEYVPGSLQASLGNVDADGAPELHWSGVLNDTAEVTISFDAIITLPAGVIQPIDDTAQIYSAPVGTLTRTVTILVNSYIFWLPGVMKR